MLLPEIILKSKALSLKNNVRIFSTNVKAVLVGPEAQRATVTARERLQAFVNSLEESLASGGLTLSVMNGYGSVHVGCRSNTRF